MILQFLYALFAVVVFRVIFGVLVYAATARVYRRDQYKDVLADKKISWLFHALNEILLGLLTAVAYASWTMGNDTSLVMGLVFGGTLGLFVYLPLSVVDLLEIKSFDAKLFALRFFPGLVSVVVSGVLLSLIYTYL